MSGEEKKNGEYKVGYKNPPTRTQFQKGKSGNPKGRPPKPKPDAASVAAALDAPLDVRISGTTKKLSAYEASVRMLVSLAINKADVAAAREFLKLCEKYGEIAPAPTVHTNNGFTIPKDWDRDEWMEKFHRDGPPPWPGDRDGLPKGTFSNAYMRNT